MLTSMQTAILHALRHHLAQSGFTLRQSWRHHDPMLFTHVIGLSVCDELMWPETEYTLEDVDAQLRRLPASHTAEERQAHGLLYRDYVDRLRNRDDAGINDAIIKAVELVGDGTLRR